MTAPDPQHSPTPLPAPPEPKLPMDTMIEVTCSASVSAATLAMIERLRWPYDSEGTPT